MNLSDPIHSIIPSVHGDVLGVLGRTSRPLSGRGVAELLDGRASVTRVSQVLQALVAEGVVLSEEHPPAILYRLNPEHLAAESIVALANLREHLVDRMRDEVRSWRISSSGAWIFGSFARGTAVSASDIDVLVVRPDKVSDEDVSWSEQLRSFTRHVSGWTGNDCRVLQVSQTELATLFEEGTPLAENLRRDAVALTRIQLPATSSTLLGAR